ncbi:MAG: lactam utilization protein LamB [Flavobacteriaceae bacterium]|nr:lactam utilization protein LamB [Flavobacteriaceae bacterium]
MSSEVKHIDINCDLGEGFPNDELIMPLISSCSIACGGHYGNFDSISKTIMLAKKHKVKIGAHPSFPDKDNFGRKLMSLTKNELTETIFHQLLQFYAVSEELEVEVHHVKLHGALYHYTAGDAPAADAVLDAIIATKSRPKLYVPYNSVLHKKAENLLPLAFEAFIDRRYLANGKLVPRSNANATINDSKEAWNQLWNIVNGNEVISIDGQNVPIFANTFCIHSDHPNTVLILKYIHSRLEKHALMLS